MQRGAGSGLWMKRILALISLPMAVLLILGCGSSERLTLEQYAAFCADGIASAEALIEPESVTWGDMLDLADASLERLRSVEPPEVLSDFHRASVRTLDFVAGVAREQPREEVANPLAFGFEAIRIATLLRRAIADLPDDVRWTLQQAECF